MLQMERQVRHAHRRLVGLLVVALLLAAGCSSGDDDDSRPGGTSAETTPASQGDPNGTIRVGYDLNSPGAPWSFDPATQTTGISVHDGWFYILYGRLLRPTEEGTLEPDMAESTEVVDANTIEIELREGQTFSDGSPFDATAVKAGLERTKALANPVNMTEPFYKLQTITVNSPTSLTLGIADGIAASWHDTFLPAFQTSIVKVDGYNPDKPIGAGPFSLTSYSPAQSASYEKFDGYWDADSITLGGIDIVEVVNEQVASGTAALSAGQLDVTITAPDQIPALTGDLELFAQPDANQQINMMMCKTDGPLADAKVRKAINKAIDREAISTAVYADTTNPATQMWPEGHRFASPELDGELAYDLDAAKALMAESAYPNGFDTNLYSVGVFNLPDAAQIIQQQLNEIGIGTTIIAGTQFAPDYLAVNAPGLGLFPGSSAGVVKLDQWNGVGLVNTCDYSDPELKGIADELAKVSQSSDEAVDLWHQANEIVIDEALSAFILFRTKLAAYDSETVASLALWPLGSTCIPNPRQTEMKAS
jgi:peptide/nickel transport system substrate-binding protein